MARNRKIRSKSLSRKDAKDAKQIFKSLAFNLDELLFFARLALLEKFLPFCE
jgi:hypothetical protein